jgi:hypothetical protein
VNDNHSWTQLRRFQHVATPEAGAPGFHLTGTFKLTRVAAGVIGAVSCSHRWPGIFGCPECLFFAPKRIIAAAANHGQTEGDGKANGFDAAILTFSAQRVEIMANAAKHGGR